jgi:hypothetical protein
MSFVDKLKFWKKEEEMPEYPRTPEISPLEPQMPSGMDQMGVPRQTPGLTEPPMEQPSFSPQSFGQQNQFQSSMSTEQQLQLISSKLDTIKAQLETVLQRLERLERGESSPYQQRWRAAI